MNGIDVSHFQGVINWHEVATGNNPKVGFAFIKATEGANYIDTMLKHNAIEADKYGIPISYYHFATLNTTNVIQDAEVEANHFVNSIKNYPKNTLPLVLDIESNKASLNKQLVLQWINAFFAKLVTLGYTDNILYSYTPFLDSNLPLNHGLSDVKLWIAAYTTKLKLPKGWAKELIWQYSAKGKVNGIHGDVDLNKTTFNFL